MDINALFENFKQQRIAVIGDVMIDAYLSGKVSRISPEAPVPIVNFESREERLGGAANVALNLLSLGAKVTICSVVGKDQAGQTMQKLMENESIDTSGIVYSVQRMTTVKTRVVGNKQQLLRVDQEQTTDLNKEEENELLLKIEKIVLSGIDALIFEDYNKGVLTEKVIREAIKLANNHDVITTVDPKLKNFLAYQEVSLFKPNFKELQEGLKKTVNIQNESELKSSVLALKNVLKAENIFVTLSEHGVVMMTDSSFYHYPAHLRNIADVSGAGDTVISVATLCLVAGVTPEIIAQIANLAGGLVCEKLGVVAIQKELLHQEIEKLIATC